MKSTPCQKQHRAVLGSLKSIIYGCNLILVKDIVVFTTNYYIQEMMINSVYSMTSTVIMILHLSGASYLKRAQKMSIK